MIKPIDLLTGFAPTREIINNENGTFTVKVTPPPAVSGPGCTLTLTADQFDRYQKWRNTGALIQDALPDLSPSQRESLMAGLSDAEFHEAAGSVPCPDCHGTGGLYASHGGQVLDHPCKTCDGSGYVEGDE